MISMHGDKYRDEGVRPEEKDGHIQPPDNPLSGESDENSEKNVAGENHARSASDSWT